MDATDQAEAETVAFALARKLREDSLPPDDAYWWTRIVYESLREVIYVQSQMEEDDAA